MSEAGDEERSRRLESDAEAVQVLTIHRSKGLEFPIVFLPFLWDMGRMREDDEPVFFHDDAGTGQTDVGLEGPEYREHKERFKREQRGEDLRLAYVALTRARHQAIAWWVPTWDCRDSPLARLLFARDEHGNIAADLQAHARRTPSSTGDSPSSRRARRTRSRSSGRRPTAGPPVAWSAPLAAPVPLSISSFDRDLDQRWRRTSFTDITAAAYDARVDSEPEQPLIDDEPDAGQPPPTPPAVAAELSVPSLLSGMGFGVDVGTFVHWVLEATDFAAPDLEAELAGADRRGLRPSTGRDRRSARTSSPDWRPRCGRRSDRCSTGCRCRDIARGDRLDELGFELPLAGGDQPTGELTLDACRRDAA